LLRGSSESIIDAFEKRNLLRGSSASIFMRFKCEICCVATLQSIRRCDDGGIDPNLERIETFAVEVASISKVYYIFGIGMKWIKKDV
jgi:plastocyanin domain-containing protein